LPCICHCWTWKVKQIASSKGPETVKWKVWHEFPIYAADGKDIHEPVTADLPVRPWEEMKIMDLNKEQNSAIARVKTLLFLLVLIVIILSSI
jgi:muconolactone delta-isomerase